MDDIRKMFAVQNGVKPGMFSFNSEGACPVCNGTGEIFPDMAFADPIAIRCEACDGKRYSQEALGYRLEGKNILDVLSMTVDEPTTGLHMADTEKLLKLLEQIVDRGNTVIVIEHNMEVIAKSDWVIDLGPGAGKNGGELIFTGTPKELTACEKSVTASELNRMLKSR